MKPIKANAFFQAPLRGRRRFVAAACLVALAGCSSTTPQYDAQFGQAVRHNRQAQVINPSAGQGGAPAAELDANTARAGLQRYRDSFKSPPPVVNVINLGTGAAAGP